MIEPGRQCAFCKIAAGQEPAGVVFSGPSCIAFLDTRPLFPGHCLVVPKEHYETLPDLPPALVEPLFSVARMLADAVPLAMGAEGTFVAINNRISQSVPHLHIHIVPRRRKDGLKGFFWPRTSYRDESEVRAVRDAICRAIASLDGPRDS